MGGHFHITAAIVVADGIQRKIKRLKALLQETQRENEVLRAQLALCTGPLPDIDLDALRRGIVFRCHPDRGGDTRLLQQVLELFDHLVGEVG